MQNAIIYKPISLKHNKITLFSCGAIKHYMHRIHSEPMKQIRLKTISGLINILQSLQNVGSVRYHFQLPGGICHCSFNLWLPATLPSKRRKTKAGERKGNTTHISLNQWETRKQSMQNTTLPFSYPLAQKLKRCCNFISVWVTAAAVCIVYYWIHTWVNMHLNQYCILADYSLPIFQHSKECKHSVLLIRGNITVKRQLLSTPESITFQLELDRISRWWDIRGFPKGNKEGASI